MRERIVLFWQWATRTWVRTIFTVALVSNVAVGLIEPTLRYRAEYSLGAFVTYQAYNLVAPLIVMSWLVRRASTPDFRRRLGRNCFLLAAVTLGFRFIVAKTVAPAIMLIVVVLAFGVRQTSFTWHDLLGSFPGPHWARVCAYAAGLGLYFTAAFLAMRGDGATAEVEGGSPPLEQR